MCLLDRAGLPVPQAEIALPVATLNRDFGYPSGVELADGSVLVAYYACDDAGVRYIAADRLVVVP